MADWHDYVGNVHEIQGKVNFIDPNDLLISNQYLDDSGRIRGEYTNDIKYFDDVIRHTWAPEDYCIDVDIMMEVPSRNDYATSVNDVFLLNWDGRSGHISMQTGQRFYYGANKADDNYKYQQSLADGTYKTFDNRPHANYMSTRDADANFQDIMTDYVSTEMLGIKSIKISYNNNFTPQVKIEMVDVNGLGIMAPLERSHTKVVNGVSGYDRNDIAGSFYRALFNLPYPKFTMKVKGLYGAPTTYDLIFHKISNNFNSSNGSYNITLDLVGYYYSFLTQVPVFHALVSPYCSLFGKDYWENKICKEDKYSLNGDKPITWIELIQRVTDAKVKISRMEDSGEGAVGRANKNQQIVNDMQDYMNIPARLLGAYFSDIVMCMQEKGVESGISAVDGGNNWDSRTGVILLASTQFDIDSLSPEHCRNHTGFFADVDASLLKYKTEYDNAKSQIETLKSTMSTVGGFDSYNVDFEEMFKVRTLANGTWTAPYSYSSEYKPIFDSYPEGEVSQQVTGPFSKMALVSICVQHGSVKKTLYAELSTILANAKQSVEELNSASKAESTKIINDNLGFVPTVRNVMKLLIEHCECYFNMIYTLAGCIGTQSSQGKRKASKLGFKMSETDFRSDDVPPFPEVTEKQNDKRVKTWTGALPTYNSFLETWYINSLVNAYNDAIDAINSSIAGNVSNSTPSQDYNPTTTTDTPREYIDNLPHYNMAIPLTFNDLLSGGKCFQNLKDSDFADYVNNGNMTAILTVVFFRALQFILAQPNSLNRTLDDGVFTRLGKSDAVNFYWQFAKQMDTNMMNKLKDTLSNSSYSEQFMKALAGDAKKDFKADGDALSRYYQSELGYTGDTLITGEYECIPANSINDGNYIQKSADENSEHSTIIKLLSNSDLIGILDPTDEDIPVEEANPDDDYRNYGTYALIDRTEKALNLNSSDFDNLYSKYGATSDDVQFQRAFTEPYSQDDDDMIGKTVYNLDDKTLIDTDLDVNNPSSENDANIFGSSYYFSMFNNGHDNALYERAMFTMYQLGEKTGFEAGQSEYVIPADKFKNALNVITGGVAKVSNMFLLQIGAVAFAHFFNNDVLYELNWSYIKSCQKYFSVNDDDEDAEWKEEDAWKDLDGKVSVIKAPDTKYNRISYILALYFIEWVKNHFSVIENTIDQTHDNMYEKAKDLHNLFEWYDTLRENPSKAKFDRVENDGFYWDVNDEIGDNAKNFVANNVNFYCYLPYSGSKYQISDAESYFKGFFPALLKIMEDDDEEANKVQQQSTQIAPVSNTTVPEDPKVSMYLATKRLWDSWLCGARQREADSYVLKNWLDVDFFDSRFHFIDSLYNDISDTVLIDANVIAQTFIEACGQQQGWSLLSYITSVLGSSRIAFYNIQNWANLGDRDTMAKAFVPMSWEESHNMDDVNSQIADNSATNSDFVCIYSHEPAHLIGYGGDGDDNAYAGDGFSIDLRDNLELPEAFGMDLHGQWKIPAFAVTYGKQYQSYFNNIQVSTENGKQTEWAMLATLNIAKMGSDKISDNTQYYGQDLYTVQSNQSFTVKVDMLGCCWVQPLMYFVLTNVPMYRGTYIVSKVEHTITAGKMTTHFEGYKMSRFANRIVDNSAMSQFGDNRTENGFSVANIVADMDNDCAYRVFPLKVEEKQTIYDGKCKTLNVESLKQHRKSGKTLWNYICGKIYGEMTDKSNTVGIKLVAMSMVNQFIYCMKNSFHSNDPWTYILEKSFKAEVVDDVPQSVQKMIEDVFTDPINAFKGETLTIPNCNIHKTRRKGKNGYSIDTSYSVLAKNIPAHYRSTDGTGTITYYGRMAMKKNASYNLRTKVNGTVGQHQPSASELSTALRTIYQYRPAVCYTADVEGLPNNSCWEWDFILIHGTREGNTQVFCASDGGAKKPIWEFSEYDSYCQKVTDASDNNADASITDIMFDCIQKSVSGTNVFHNDTVKKVATYKNHLVVSMETKTYNKQLFDMLVRTPKNGVQRGYYGFYDRIAWLGKTGSGTYPDYIIMEVSMAQKKPTIYFKAYGNSIDTDITALSDELIEKLYKSKSYADICNSAGGYAGWLKTNYYNATLAQIMANNVDTSNAENEYTVAFAPMWGGTDAYSEWWTRQDESDPSISKILQELAKNTKNCAEVVKEAETNDTNGALIGADMDVNTLFENTGADGKDYKERAIWVAKDKQLEIHKNQNQEGNRVLSFVYGADGNPCRITSHWALVRRLRDRSPNKHQGTDFSHGSIKASYDGKCIGTMSSVSGYGTMFFIAYNIHFQMSDGSWRTLVCGYGHCASVPISLGTVVHAGQYLCQTGNSGTGTGPHLHLVFMLLTDEDINRVLKLNGSERRGAYLLNLHKNCDRNRDLWEYINWCTGIPMDGAKYKHNERRKYGVDPNYRVEAGWKYIPR